MKKHIFGLLIFGLIVALTAIGVAYFYAPPIPQIAEINEPLVTNQTPTSCFPRFANQISVKVETTQIYLDEDKLVSRIKLKWNKETAPPAKIYLKSEVFTLENLKKSNFLDTQIINEPFINSNEAEITVISKIKDWQNIDESANYYAVFRASENELDNGTFPLEMKKALAQHVELSHGEKSIIRK